MEIFDIIRVSGKQNSEVFTFSCSARSNKGVALDDVMSELSLVGEK